MYTSLTRLHHHQREQVNLRSVTYSETRCFNVPRWSALCCVVGYLVMLVLRVWSMCYMCHGSCGVVCGRHGCPGCVCCPVDHGYGAAVIRVSPERLGHVESLQSGGVDMATCASGCVACFGWLSPTSPLLYL